MLACSHIFSNNQGKSIHVFERVQTSETETIHSVDLRIGISTSADLRTRTGGRTTALSALLCIRNVDRSEAEHFVFVTPISPGTNWFWPGLQKTTFDF